MENGGTKELNENSAPVENETENILQIIEKTLQDLESLKSANALSGETMSFHTGNFDRSDSTGGAIMASTETTAATEGNRGVNAESTMEITGKPTVDQTKSDSPSSTKQDTNTEISPDLLNSKQMIDEIREALNRIRRAKDSR